MYKLLDRAHIYQFMLREIPLKAMLCKQCMNTENSSRLEECTCNSMDEPCWPQHYVQDAARKIKFETVMLALENSSCLLGIVQRELLEARRIHQSKNPVYAQDGRYKLRTSCFPLATRNRASQRGQF